MHSTCINAFHMHTETYRESPDPSFPVRDTESDPRWGWLGLACETIAPTYTQHLEPFVVSIFNIGGAITGYQSEKTKAEVGSQIGHRNNTVSYISGPTNTNMQ